MLFYRFHFWTGTEGTAKPYQKAKLQSECGQGNLAQNSELQKWFAH
jgi:hypothetical protein